MTHLSQTCACGAAFTVDDTYHYAGYVYKQLEDWRTEHAKTCPLTPSDTPAYTQPTSVEGTQANQT